VRCLVALHYKDMKAMAKRIIAAQRNEIAEFDKWMKKHP